MATRSSPTVRRRRLAAELRQLRRESGKNRDEVADYVGCSPVTITRIESAQTAGTVAIVARILDFYGVKGERNDVLLTLCRQARKRGWWHQYSGAIPAWFEVYIGLEEEAADVRMYEAEAIPGLLQTEGYIRGIMLADTSVPPEDEIERRIDLRMKRQERLMGDDAPSMGVVLNEACLRRHVGGAETMREQLQYLADVSRLDHVLLQVLPYSAGAHPAMDGAFNLLRFPEPADPDVVYVQYRRGSIYLEEASDVEDYATLFEHLRARALGPDDSRALIARVADEMS